MQGTMMHYPLTLIQILEQAGRNFAKSQLPDAFIFVDELPHIYWKAA